MKKKLRNGVDISVALDSALKRNVTHEEVLKLVQTAMSPKIGKNIDQEKINNGLLQKVIIIRDAYKEKIKKNLSQTFIRPAYRFLEPFVRPFRRFLIDQLRSDIICNLHNNAQKNEIAITQINTQLDQIRSQLNDQNAQQLHQNTQQITIATAQIGAELNQIRSWIDNQNIHPCRQDIQKTLIAAVRGGIELEQIIVLGAGGHAKVCIELLQTMGERVAYCIGDNESPLQCLGVPVLKGDKNLAHLYSKGFSKVFVAVGDNKLRNRLASLALQEGYSLVNAISSSAAISPSAVIGSGIAIMAGAIINAEARIDDLAIINTGATIDHDCQIGHAVHISPQCALAGNVRVGRHAFLGVGTKVIPGVIIGKKAVIGAGSVVITNILSGTTVMGVPAKQQKEELQNRKLQ